MKNNTIKNYIWFWVLSVYCLCFCFRLIEYFFIRTDETFFGEAFIHKLLGIIILFVTAGFLSFNLNDIGFSRKKCINNLFLGFLLGLFCFFIGYTIEIIILQNSGNFEKLSLFVTSYSVNGNLGNHTELIFFLICILGNIINVVMAPENSYCPEISHQSLPVSLVSSLAAMAESAARVASDDNTGTSQTEENRQVSTSSVSSSSSSNSPKSSGGSSPCPDSVPAINLNKVAGTP